MEIEFNGKKYEVNLENIEENNINLEECLTALNNDELFDYLYNYQIKMFEEINNEPYFEGKTIKSGKDLKNSIESIDLISYNNEVIYVCGEYWCDPEHGFSIAFPKGKFIKSQYSNYEYDRDQGETVDYIPVCTVLGQFSDGCL